MRPHMRETSHEGGRPPCQSPVTHTCYKLRSLERSRQLVADTQTQDRTTMEFAKEKMKHLTYLRKIRPRPIEVQNVLTYSVQQFSEDTRLEYMSFIEDNNLQHSWAAILTWWRYRKHTNMDKTTIQTIKRTMEVKKREEYTLLNTCRKQKTRSPPPLAVAASPEKISPKDNNDDEGTPRPRPRPRPPRPRPPRPRPPRPRPPRPPRPPPPPRP